MTLFHASKTPIPEPDPYHGRKNADIGQGCYLSPDEEFSLLWAKEGWYINQYEFDDEGLNFKKLELGEEWFDVIFENRNRVHDTLSEYDVVLAPIANDTIFDLVGILTSGFVPKKTCLEVLKLEPHFYQLVLKNDKAIKNLKFIGSRVVSAEEASQNKVKANELSDRFLSSAMAALGHYGDILS